MGLSVEEASRMPFELPARHAPGRTAAGRLAPGRLAALPAADFSITSAKQGDFLSCVPDNLSKNSRVHYFYWRLDGRQRGALAPGSG
jgi:hypothetical protein